MLDLDFDKARWSMDSEGLWLSLRVKVPALARRFVETVKDRVYTARIQEKRPKRSLDANAYCWVLLGRLSEELSKNGTVRIHSGYVPAGDSLPRHPGDRFGENVQCGCAARKEGCNRSYP